MSSKTLHDITVSFVTETAKAVMYDDGKNQFWVPKSVMTDSGMIQVEENRDGKTYTLTAPEWWLKERGLI